jgi:NADH dehydrogenase (ubiquinone) 1 alpha subcomplex subunit 13
MLGFYRAGTYNNMMKAEMLEERKARYAIAPILQAEADRAYLVQEKEILRQEAEIMKNVPGWKVGASTYTGDRWIPRNMAVLHKGLK